MAIGTPAHVAPGGTNITGASTVVSTATGAIAAAQTLFGFTGWRLSGASGVTLSTADSVNGAYTEDVEHFDSTELKMGSIDRFSNNGALATSDTLTATQSGASGVNTSALAWVGVTGLDLSAPLDQSNAGGGFSSSPSSGDITPTAGERLVFAGLFLRTNAAGIITNDLDYAYLSDVLANNGTSAQSSLIRIGWLIDTFDGETAIGFTPSLSGSATWVALIASYKAAAAGGVNLAAIAHYYKMMGMQ